jgi:hypothetical protein
MWARIVNWLERKPAHTAAALLFFLTLLFLSQGLFPGDGQALGAHDMRGLFYPWLSTTRAAILEGRIPAWDPYQFGGYPFLSNPQVAFFYPPTWLAIVLPSQIGISWYIVLHTWLAAFGMWLYVRAMGGSRLGALLAAITFGFSGFVAARLWAGHIGLLATFTWLPWMLLATVWSLKRGHLWSAVVAGVPFGLAILAGHTPSLIYVGLIWGAFVMYLLLVRSEERRLILRQAAVMATVGLGISAVQLLPFLQLTLNSQRLAGSDFEFATEFSFPPAHLITLLFPEFFGEPTRIGYWSVPTFEELSYYAGIVSVLGLVLALRRPTSLTWFYVVLMFCGLMLALGSYGVLYRLLYQLSVPVQLMRAPARAMVLYLFSASALLGHAISQWQHTPLEARKTALIGPLRWTIIIAGVAFLAALLATGALFMAVHPTETSGRLWHQVGGYAFGLFVLVLSGLLIWAYLVTPPNRVRKRRLFAGALLVVVIMDLWQFGFKLIRPGAVGPDSFWLDAKAIIGETEAKVVPWGLPIFSQSGSMEVGMYSVFGYQALEPANLIALTASVPDPRSSAYDVLGARYVIAPVPLEQYTEGDSGLTLVEKSEAAWVYERAEEMPVARLVYEVEVIADTERAIARIHEADFDPAESAILDASPPCLPGPKTDGQPSVEIEEMAAGYWRILTRSVAPGLLLLAESDYPGWEVTVDGRPAEELTAYGVIRAVCVEAGEHLVEWTYRPGLFFVGGAITIISFGIVVASFLLGTRAKRV